ncbi:uncharacterized protein LOC113233185 isoform X2 [Hyposmocoma kahamanoa]|uniref:uncharacterized protein LOC113233185 isoform X2 n=1 Tax=Hyposmocoma kahamanoa TaxID=1477025 RepID=UPI000E6D9054|nr:uncharacterized protein LOC113233185 isoform X2 [Hyposmocoma kahamanoa]
MYLVSAALFLIAQTFHVVLTVNLCDEIKCSHVYDPVCGIVKKPGDTRIVRVYQNICHLKKIQCKIEANSEVLQAVPDEICHLNRVLTMTGQTRRLEDHSIVGAYQACNHTCPTFCVDTYEPVCAQIWREGMQKYFFRPMVNHCHVDLVSCTLAVNGCS